MTIPVARPVSIPVAQPVQVNVTVNAAATPSAPTRANPLNTVWGQLLGTAAKAVGTWMTAHSSRPPAQHQAPVHHEQPQDRPIFDDEPSTMGTGDWGTTMEVPMVTENFGFAGFEFPTYDAFGGFDTTSGW